MTNLHDQLRDDIKAEEHSLASIAGVSIVMIVATLASMSLFI